ncbi:MAG: CDP-alcohol phosphatidyltransferase family protein [Clostridia bacterium]|nr:CDP-alcohol phosphatidyltransferase family protein [Clostridia bacterium]
MQILNVTWKWNVPNALSLVRILLIPVFLVLYLNHLDWWAFGVLAFSGLTDMLDGFIARHFNQITDCGKLLDPISDKLTQVAVLVALATRYSELMWLVILCVIKETCQAVGGAIMLKRQCAVQGSLWFGKLSTIVFYLCMLVLVVTTLFGVTLSSDIRWLLVGLAGACMLVAFVGYLRVFIFSRKGKSVSSETEKG